MTKAIKSLKYSNPEQSAAQVTANVFRVGKCINLNTSRTKFTLHSLLQHTHTRTQRNIERRLWRKQNQETNRELEQKDSRNLSPLSTHPF